MCIYTFKFQLEFEFQSKTIVCIESFWIFNSVEAF